MRRLRRGALVAAATVLLLAPPVAAQDDDSVPDTGGRTVFQVGVLQDLDSFNLTVGYLVSTYEAWNLHYPSLTGYDSEFETIPGIAESWEVSDNGLTVTFTLRDGLTWSDGEPLTASDVAYTINRSRDEEWFNHYAVTANLDAVVIDDTTVEITSSVPDPRLPGIEIYLVPEHVYVDIDADELSAHSAFDDPGAGPFIMQEWRTGQFWRMAANPDFWGGRPAVDEVIFRVFTNADAMVTALQSGEIDAAAGIPGSQAEALAADPNITVVTGTQGGFTEVAMNAGMGLGDGHPALTDPVVRRAIAHAIDREAIIDRALDGFGTLTPTMVPSADPDWDLVIEADEEIAFDLEEANRLLDEAGYVDTDGDGVREMPDGSQPLRFRYLSRSESAPAPVITELVTGWLDEIGIATTVEVLADSQLGVRLADGTYEMFSWGWVPFVDPDFMLSYFTCDQLTVDADEPGYNDAAWCSEEYDELYEAQGQELDRDQRRAIVSDMLRIFRDGGAYVVLYKEEDINAFRNDRFSGVVCQPTDTGPFLFNMSSATYAAITPVADGEAGTADCGGRGEPGEDELAAGPVDEDSGSSTTTIIIIVVAVVVVAAVLVGVILGLRRRPAAADRE